MSKQTDQPLREDEPMEYTLVQTPFEVSLVQDGEGKGNFSTEETPHLDHNPLADLVKMLKPGDTLTYVNEGA